MRLLIRLLVIAGLAIDVYFHFKKAGDFDAVKNADGFAVSAGFLFRAQAVVALIALVIIVIWANRVTYLLAFLVMASALGALLFYHYFDPGPIGPIPNMSDPTWFPDKVWTAVGEGVGTVVALIGALLPSRSTDSAHGRAGYAAQP